MAAGDQESISLQHAQEAGVAGALLGGALTGAGSGAAAINNAGGLKTVLNSIKLPDLNVAGPRLALAGEGGGLPGSGVLWMKGKPNGHIPDDVYEHIHKGGINKAGRPTGYHHRPGGKDPVGTKVPKITGRDNKTGLTRGPVWMKNPRNGEWVQKRVNSTFFPDTWTPKEVNRAIETAFSNSEVVEGSMNMWRGTYKGIRIEGYFDSVTGDAITAYPVLPK
ncbi:EndoU domain-containing protein [Streptomyces sp. NPDC002795]|uniref:EndoU domain-containing protein n=1 Tax=Streptomyces sp. NPDC002795 TaxID=3364665 RepID=UPI0036957F9F